MTKYQALVTLRAVQEVAEHGSVEAAMAAVEKYVTDSYVDSFADGAAERRFFRAVLKRLGTLPE